MPVDLSRYSNDRSRVRRVLLTTIGGIALLAFLVIGNTKSGLPIILGER